VGACLFGGHTCAAMRDQTVDRVPLADEVQYVVCNNKYKRPYPTTVWPLTVVAYGLIHGLLHS
jgi:hypothetical protein